ncbi:MAG: aspartate aminotransferase family protein [bacterium]
MIHHHIVYNPVLEWRFDLARGEGSHIWDSDGKEYIDFSSGWNTTNLGWNNPEINQAMIDQISKNTFIPMWLADQAQIDFAKALVSSFPTHLDTALRATGGTEANEMALKIVRAVTGRSKIVSFAHTYHGQSFGTLALGYIPAYVKAISPIVPDFVQMDYPDAFSENHNVLADFLVKLEDVLKNNDVAAVFTEAGMITGWGSMLVAPDGYLTAVRELTKKYGTLLVVDEVGSGFSRTGKLFAIEHENVVPDLVTLAKAINNGACALGAVVTNGALVEKYAGSFKPTSTNGWSPLACAAGTKNLEIHKRDKVWEMAEEKGKFVKEYLSRELSGHHHLNKLRGKGLEIAFNLGSTSEEVEGNSNISTELINRCTKNSLHLADAGDCVQLMPPLTISQEDLEKGLSILVSVVKGL